jgi:hypothetical protein
VCLPVKEMLIIFFRGWSRSTTQRCEPKSWTISKRTESVSSAFTCTIDNSRSLQLFDAPVNASVVCSTAASSSPPEQFNNSFERSQHASYIRNHWGSGSTLYWQSLTRMVCSLRHHRTDCMCPGTSQAFSWLA